MDSSPPGSSVHGTLQARILECVAIPFSRGSSWPRDQTQVFCNASRFFTFWAIREAPGNLRVPAKCRGIREIFTKPTLLVVADRKDIFVRKCSLCFLPADKLFPEHKVHLSHVVSTLVCSPSGLKNLIISSVFPKLSVQMHSKGPHIFLLRNTSLF